MEVPDGFVLVPIEATDKMLHAAFVAMNETPSGLWKRMKAESRSQKEIFVAKMRPRYAAMVRAAALPDPPQ